MIPKFRILIVIAVALVASSFSMNTTTSSGIKWVTLDEAIERSKKESKPIFMDVYTDWCGWCKRMDATTFSDPSVVEYVNKHYVAVKFNAEQNTTVTFKDEKISHIQLVRKLGVGGYPSIILMDKNQNTKLFPGYRTAEQFKTMLFAFKSEQK